MYDSDSRGKECPIGLGLGYSVTATEDVKPVVNARFDTDSQAIDYIGLFLSCRKCLKGPLGSRGAV